MGEDGLIIKIVIFGEVVLVLIHSSAAFISSKVERDIITSSSDG